MTSRPDVRPATDPTTTRRPWGLLLVATGGPLLILASELVRPRHPDELSAAEEASWLTTYSTELLWSYLLGLVAAAFLSAGFVLLGSRFRGRGRLPGRVGAVLGVAGAAGLAGHKADSLRIRDLILADPRAAEVVQETEFGVAGVATVFPVIFGVTLGLVLLAVAGARAGWVGWWAVVVAVLALVGDFSESAFNTVFFVVLAIPVMAALAAAAPDQPAGLAGRAGSAEDTIDRTLARG